MSLSILKSFQYQLWFSVGMIYNFALFECLKLGEFFMRVNFLSGFGITLLMTLSGSIEMLMGDAVCYSLLLLSILTSEFSPLANEF